MSYTKSQYYSQTIRSALVLTTSYVAASTVQVQGFTQLVLYVNFTKGSLDSGEIKIEFSDDNSTFFQESFEDDDFTNALRDIKVFHHKMSATGTYRIPIPVTDNYIKVSGKGTGTVSGSSLTLALIQGTN